MRQSSGFPLIRQARGADKLLDLVRADVARRFTRPGEWQWDVISGSGAHAPRG
jgi:hypothetical protein